MKKIVCYLLLILAVSLHGDLLYEVQEISELLAFDKSEARSLNQQGTVVGKYQVDGNYVDFISIPQTQSFHSVEKEISADAYPVVNNKNEFVGITDKVKPFLFKRRISNYYLWMDGKRTIQGTDVVVEDQSWWSALFKSPKKNIEVKAFNDHQDRLFHAYQSGVWISSVVVSDRSPYMTEREHIFAINNKTDMLVEHQEQLSILDKWRTEIVCVPKQPLLGVAINDRRTIIAANKDKTEGFFGTIQDLNKGEIISLGSLIPIALNNHGDIIGKVPSQKGEEDSTFWLRKQDGTLIELSGAVDFGPFSSEKIVEVWAINDQGQILVSMTFEGTTHVFLLNPKENDQ